MRYGRRRRSRRRSTSCARPAPTASSCFRSTRSTRRRRPGSSARGGLRVAGAAWVVAAARRSSAPFYDDPGFIDAFAGAAARRCSTRSGPITCCSASTACPSATCTRPTPAARTAWRRRAAATRSSPPTATATARSASRPRARSRRGWASADGAWSVSFQSRLGRTPWIRPYTDVVLPELAAAGKKRARGLLPRVRRRLPRDARGDRHPRARATSSPPAARASRWCRRSTPRPRWVDAVVSLARRQVGGAQQ